MKYLYLIVLAFSFSSCQHQEKPLKDNKEMVNPIIGSWKMVYAETFENDTLKLKDLSTTTFVKIINASHFSFFNQSNDGGENFYGGAGSYTLKGADYLETLTFTSVDAIRNHQFPFTVEFKGDTLIQAGLEEVKEAGIKRKIIEKYVRIK